MKSSNYTAVKKYNNKNKHNVAFICRNMSTRSKRRAIVKQWEFDLSGEYLKSIWPLDNKCPVFGIDFFTDLPGNQNCASLDRIDTTKGYIKGNVCIVSYKANSLKYDGSLHEFKAVLDYMHRLGAT